MLETVLLNTITFFSYFSSDYFHVPKILNTFFFPLESDFPLHGNTKGRPFVSSNYPVYFNRGSKYV